MNKNKSLVFINVAIHFATYQYAIGKKLEEKGISVAYVTYSKEAANFLKKRRCDVSYIPDVIKNYKLRKPIVECLKDIEGKYDANTNLILLGDYDHSFMKREKAFESMIKNFMFWENYLKRNKAGMIIGGSERFISMIPDIICKKNKIRYYWWTRATIDNHFVLTQAAKEGRWSVLEEYWKRNKNRNLTLEERKKAEEIANTITKEKKTLYLVVGTPRITINQILFFLKRLFLNIFVEKFRNPYARVTGIAWDKTKRAFKKYFIKHLYLKPDLNEKFILYPLHLEDDTQILVRAPQYADQISLIKYIAKCLPANYKLYVKEHPNNIGGMKIKKLKAIKDTPDVKLISPYFPSHDLIKNAQAIITINSTVGWEGLLYEKPVIVLGTCFYENSGMVWRVHDLYELPTTIKKALKERIATHEKLLRFVNAVANSVYPGNLNFYYQYAKKAMTDENISLIAEGISKELNKT